MDIGVIAKRYAKALWAYAVETDSETVIYDEILHFIATYRAVPQLAEVLGNPLLPGARKTEMICAAAAEAVSPVFQKFATLVVAHHRESYMLFIAHSYVSLYRDRKHISIGRLITPVPVTEAIKQRIEKMVESSSADTTQLIFDTVVDPNLLGGFVFEIDDHRLDASVASQFERIKKQFIEKNKRII